ncbi:hypothetical protein LCGC14_1244280 [marine sediment metagenome]|uniref:Uncharacterized protein n=1 Tax=marine sediment metagenome TaxID=412755 RepID=A0A0F9L4W9_9ZZZZ
MLDPSKTYTPNDFTLLDDGTLDTVVRLPDGTEWRYHRTSEYRDVEGVLDFETWVMEVVFPDILNAGDSLWLEE